MKQLRKIITIGGSLGITIPGKWLEFYEFKHGQKIHEVLVEVQDESLIIIPIAPPKKECSK